MCLPADQRRKPSWFWNYLSDEVLCLKPEGWGVWNRIKSQPLGRENRNFSWLGDFEIHCLVPNQHTRHFAFFLAMSLSTVMPKVWISEISRDWTQCKSKVSFLWVNLGLPVLPEQQKQSRRGSSRRSRARETLSSSGREGYNGEGLGNSKPTSLGFDCSSIGWGSCLLLIGSSHNREESMVSGVRERSCL